MSRTFGLFLILRDPDLRLIAGLMTLQGAFVCTLGPDLSVLAVRQFGLGDRGDGAATRDGIMSTIRA